MTDIQIFNYNGNGVTFRKGNSVMINATEMAKPFSKEAKHWLTNQSTNDYIAELSKVRNLTLADLVKVTRGGNNAGTWMHEDVALEFARWLSPSFAIWCNDRIKELMQVGFTATPATLEELIDNPDLVIAYATKIKQLREENTITTRLLAEKTEQLDESKDWYSIKRWAKHHHKNWRNYSWRKLKAVSHELGYEVKKIFDSNFDEVNIYHRVVFEAVYGK